MATMTVYWKKKKNVAVFVASYSPQGEVLCVRQRVIEDSSPSSFAPQIASRQVTERDLSFQLPPSHILTRHCFMFTAPKLEEKTPRRIHFSPAINPLRQVMYPPLSPYCGPFSPRASYGSTQKDQIYYGRPLGFRGTFFFFFLTWQVWWKDLSGVLLNIGPLISVGKVCVEIFVKGLDTRKNAGDSYLGPTALHQSHKCPHHFIQVKFKTKKINWQKSVQTILYQIFFFSNLTYSII